jgi:hypothetical protein
LDGEQLTPAPFNWGIIPLVIGTAANIREAIASRNIDLVLPTLAAMLVQIKPGRPKETASQ